MRKYLVTGGTGFIGSNLVRRLVFQGKKVFLIVEKNSDFWRLQDIISKIKILEVDLREFDKVKSWVKNIKPDIIFHLAAYGVFTSQRDQKYMFDTNFYGTVNLFNACKGIGFDCFINTGSSSEYGLKNSIMNENDFLEPVNDYGVSKVAGTMFCLKEALFDKLPVYTIRPFTAYGNFEAFGRLIPSIFINFLQNKQINLSLPHFVRDFIYVEDIVDFYLMLCEKRPRTNFIFNAGTGVQSTIKDVIEKVQSFLDKKMIVCWNKLMPRPCEPEVWQACINRAKTVVGWEPKYSLEQGLKESFKWFKKNLHLYVRMEKKFSRKNKIRITQ